MTKPQRRHHGTDSDALEHRQYVHRQLLLQPTVHSLATDAPGPIVHRVLGIDPGKRGYMVALNADAQGMPCLLVAVPLAGFLDPKKRWDVGLLQDRLRDWAPTLAVLERQWARPQCSSRTAFDTGQSYGMTKAVLTCLRIPMFIPSPVHWQPHTSNLVPGEDPKVRSILYTNTQRPGFLAQIMKSYRDGAADAFCLATYGLQQLRAGRQVYGEEP